MIEIRIHGRGGQGGVTLAKILATAHHLRGKSVQAFGIYAAERSGAPLQAFLRYDDQPIRNRNQIYEPDHVIVLDPTLISPQITSGLKPDAFILINTADAPSAFSKQEPFSAYKIATVDATAIARKHKLGTKSVPIVNTALAGATARMFDTDLAFVLNAFEKMGFRGGNLEAAREAYEKLKISEKPRSRAKPGKVSLPTARVPGLINGNTGARPTIRTGQWATQQPYRKESIPPCNFVCPAGNDVQGFLEALAKEDVNGALRILLKTTPLPSICGRVCPGFCMEQCNRIQLDEAVNIRALERYAGDHGEVPIERPKPRKEKVAVVGSGPAGLSSAYQLARLGYQVTLYEVGSELGGLMRTGIPAYRLPPDVLDREIDRVLKLGVRVILNRRVEKNALDQLLTEFDAVLVATGLQKETQVDLGAGDERVLQGLTFLDQARNGNISIEKENIVVIGGGNTAIDAARSAWRLGAQSVQIVYRRTREEMPAINEEVEETIDEGIDIRFLLSPTKVIRKDSRPALLCQEMKLGEPGPDGRRKPVPIPGKEIEIACDRVILALGQTADLSLLPENKTLSKELSSDTEIAAAGDLLTNEGTVTAAIGCGRETALKLHEKFTGERLFEDPPAADRVIRADRIKMHLFHKTQKSREATLPATVRRHSFNEVRSGLESYDEAKRCLSCGVCNDCGRCVTFCPDGVIRRVENELVFDYEYCKGCGVCVSECPRSVIYFKTGSEG